MRYRYLLWNEKLLLFSMLVAFYAFSSHLRVAIRAILEGREFQWAYFAGVEPDGSVSWVSGQDPYGDFDYVLIAAFALVWLLCAGFRRPDRQFQAALLGYTSLAAFSALWLTTMSNDRLTSAKDTLGLSGLSHFWIDVLPTLLAWALSLALFVRGLLCNTIHRPAPWLWLNTVLLLAALVLLLVSAACLNVGAQHAMADFYGVGMIYMSLCFFWLGMSPWSRRSQTEPTDCEPTGHGRFCERELERTSFLGGPRTYG